MFSSVLAADSAHFALFCGPRTVEPGRQVLALHAVVLEAQVPQDDWLGTQEVVERCRVQLLICGRTTPASFLSQRQTVETKLAAWRFRPAFGKLKQHLDQVRVPFLGVSVLQLLDHYFTPVFLHPEELSEQCKSCKSDVS